MSEAQTSDEILFYPVDTHYTPAGYQIATNAISDFLMSLKNDYGCK